MIDVVSWFMIALFVGWSIFFLICLVKFPKSRNPKASYHGVKNHTSTHLEIGVVIVEAVLLLGFALPLWAKRTDEYALVLEREPVRVRAIGFQFGWNFHYAGNDGEFGYVDRTLVSKVGDACIDPTDPNGFDDFVVGNTLKLPVGRPAIVQVTSTDVIHNFSIIPMRIQQDAIPGKDIPMWFTPTKELVTHVVCGQLCGEGHANMIGTLEVVSQDAFAKWSSQLSQESFEKNKAAAEAAANKATASADQ